MTLEELSRELPNGFHDAKVLTLAFDLVARTATIDLELWVGDETLRPARLELRGVAYFVVDAPDPAYPYAEAGPITVDLCDPDSTSRLPPTRSGDFAARFFVSEWNAFLSVSARESALRWAGE
jgi:hypothetical protein